ncbi:MAG: hypothetical protein ABWY66_13700 [Xanthobacteraceae bacterium]|jgi:hypothetical protein
MKKKKSIAFKPSTAPCAVCDGPMKHIRTIPAAGFMSEMHSFRCTVCGCPRTEDRLDGPQTVQAAEHAAA